MESGGLGSGVLKSGGGVRGVEVGGLGSGELESGGRRSENLELGVWGRRSCGWGGGVGGGVGGVGSEKLGSGGWH